ncbi:MAG: hypothetical protein QM537_05465 [Candidatus Symbiobacter sp.]|nr:hypothetical protein [Candidatus Symbiobacter sp.]
MEKISRQSVEAKHKLVPRRRSFANSSGIQAIKQNGTKSFSVKFSETIKPIFEAETELALFYSDHYKNHFRVIKSDEELHIIENWGKKQGNLVFLRDCLSLSLALDFNLKDKAKHEYTDIGLLENKAKHHKDQNAIEQIAEMVTQTIQPKPFYKDADLICSVPAHPDKEFDLPGTIASMVCSKMGIRNVTQGFHFGVKKPSIKTTSFSSKWDIWENSQVTFDNDANYSISDKNIILIDDKYQSGITIQYIAMILQMAGANDVYGLSFVKTLRDTDNT